MDTAKEYVDSHGLSLSLDEESGLNYASYEDKDGVFTQIWMEDVDSLSSKLDLVNGNGIGGAAFWKLTMESKDVWDVINEKLAN